MYTKTVSITLVIVICVFLGLYGLVGLLQSGMFQCRPSEPCWSDSKAGGAGAAGLQNNTRSYVELEEYKKCAGRYIYVYDLPPQFNQKIVVECHNDPVWPHICEDLSNRGIGEQFVLESNDSLSNILLPHDAWYRSTQWTLEHFYHERFKEYPCLTDDPEKAAFSYIPFYGALDMTQNLWNRTMAHRDRMCQRLVGWLQNSRHWQVTGGHKHLLVLGRIAWDLTRQEFEDGWGSPILSLTELENVTKVLIEKDHYRQDQMAMPYPSSFHPYADDQIVSWQRTMLSSQRNHLVLFAGGPRAGKTFSALLRDELMRQCLNSSRCLLLRCDIIDCERNPQILTQNFLNSVFCLQPPGDSPTRKGVFDCLVSGTIPVIFDENTIYQQYMEYLPKKGRSYSVLFDGHAVLDGKIDVLEELHQIPTNTIAAMQMTINGLLPNIIYSKPGSNVSTRDAFDITIDSLLHRFRVQS